MGLFHDDDSSPYQGASTTAAYALWQFRRGGGTGTNNVTFVPAAQTAKSANDLRLEAEEKAAIAKAIAAKEARVAATALARWEADHWEEICAARDAAEAAAVAADDRLAASRR